MKHLALAALLILAPGCASLPDYEDMRHRAEEAEARVTEREMWLAGKDADNAMLQAHAIQLTDEIRRWQGGAMLQALELQQVRQGCDI